MSTTSSETTTAIEREIAIAARPETVWEFLVDPEKAVPLDGPHRRSWTRSPAGSTASR